ncbi:MAG: hypothetical protein LBI43_07925 [Streptococcaceae bacterium]|jgi:Rgg/GadR/MutR family transcriptional activator|nr:hypothetical protein [Streptococcaceae bacterium]
MIDKNYGEIFHAIRKQRGFKVMSFEPGVSKSAISRFEMGETALPIDKLVYALDKMKLSLAEFESFSNDFEASKHNEKLTQLYPLFYHLDAEGLLRLLGSKDWTFRLAAQALYNELTNGKSLRVGEQTQLMRYFLGLSDWGTYELTIAYATISQFSAGQIKMLFEKIKDDTSYHNQIFHYGRRVSQIFLKGAFGLIIVDEEKSAREILDYTRQFTKKDDLFSLALLYFLEGCYTYHFDLARTREGLAQIREAMHIFTVLGSGHHAEFLRAMAQKYLVIGEMV